MELGRFSISLTARPFTDVREIQRTLLAQGMELEDTVDEGTAGPGHVTMIDPDGNAIPIDPHR